MLFRNVYSWPPSLLQMRKDRWKYLFIRTALKWERQSYASLKVKLESFGWFNRDDASDKNLAGNDVRDNVIAIYQNLVIKPLLSFHKKKLSDLDMLEFPVTMEEAKNYLFYYLHLATEHYRRLVSHGTEPIETNVVQMVELKKVLNRFRDSNFKVWYQEWIDLTFDLETASQKRERAERGQPPTFHQQIVDLLDLREKKFALQLSEGVDEKNKISYSDETFTSLYERNLKNHERLLAHYYSTRSLTDPILDSGAFSEEYEFKNFLRELYSVLAAEHHASINNLDYFPTEDDKKIAYYDLLTLIAFPIHDARERLASIHAKRDEIKAELLKDQRYAGEEIGEASFDAAKDAIEQYYVAMFSRALSPEQISETLRDQKIVTGEFSWYVRYDPRNYSQPFDEGSALFEISILSATLARFVFYV